MADSSEARSEPGPRTTTRGRLRRRKLLIGAGITVLAGVAGLGAEPPASADVRRLGRTGSSAARSGPEHRRPTLNRIELPAGFQPEGIATDFRFAYLGSRADGRILRVDPRTGAQAVLASGTGSPSLGLKVDLRNRLFVAGGISGEARVIDTHSGARLATYQLQQGTTFINDVVLTPDGVYLTDSNNSQLFLLPLRRGRLPASSEVRRIPLGGEWQQSTGVNANGLVITPDGRAVLVVNSANGRLYRVDPDSGVARVVDLGGYLLTNGDGLLREGTRLYVVQNRLNLIAVLELAPDGRSGRLIRTISSPDFDVPTTVARFGQRFLLPNARFTTPPTPTTAYWITSVEVGAGLVRS